LLSTKYLTIASLLAITATQSSLAATTPIIRDLPALKLAFAGLLKGTHKGEACSDVPDLKGTGNRPGTVSVTANGDIIAERTRVSMFDPAAEFSITKHYASRSGKPDHGFGYSLFIGDTMVSLTTNLTSTIGFSEAGKHGGTRNVTEGMQCARIDLSGAKVAPESYDFNELLVPVFDTGGAFVEGRCMSTGKRKETRMSRFRVSATGVQLNDTWLAFGDAINPVVMSGIGSRLADGTLNGGFTWKDGSGLHMERRFGGTDDFAAFGYTLVDKGTPQRFLCRVGR